MNDNNTTLEKGRPTQLDDKLIKDIGSLIIAGKAYTEIATLLDIDYGTMMNWRYTNYLGFYEKMMLFEAQKQMIKATDVINDVLAMNVLTANGETSSRLMKIKADMATFVAETVAKQVYSKRTENTGANGEAMTIKIVKYELPATIDIEATENGSVEPSEEL